MRRPNAAFAICTAVLLMAIMGACGTPAASTGNPRASQASRPTTTAQTPTAQSGGCPPAWRGWPDTSASILGGLVALPPRTRVVLVDSAPGMADADLCTLGLAAGGIDQFMKANLPAKGWRYDAAAGKWRNGPALELDYLVADPLRWEVECVCGGI